GAYSCQTNNQIFPLYNISLDSLDDINDGGVIRPQCQGHRMRFGNPIMLRSANKTDHSGL
ncbi:hypothetical protein OVV85_26755, partial [Klebsiella pneumoniae]|uniref:hypothetical protein n=1 Tax=Klebsiella pneumoniae TaxID=573 RepID=UPI00226D87A5